MPAELLLSRPKDLRMVRRVKLLDQLAMQLFKKV
jgi:hypothetical protein